MLNPTCVATSFVSPRSLEQPTILLGVTHPQTCLILGARLRRLREAGFHVLLVSGPGKLVDQTAAREGVERITIPMRRGIAPLDDILSFIRLWKLIGERRPQIVEFSTPKAGLLGTLAAWLRRVPSRVYMLRGLRLQTTLGLERLLLLISEHVAAACAHVVLCNSPSLRTVALDLGIGSAAKIRLLGHGSSNGVDVERFRPGPDTLREQLGIPRDVPLVGFVGRLTRDKGLPELMHAFELMQEKAPDIHMLFVGWFDESEDALPEKLRKQILSHPCIHCTGFVADTAPYYRSMDMMVLPSWREGFPNAVLEAAATGIPTITTECTGARDSVIPEVTGLLIPPGYPDAICEAVINLARDPERRLRMGRAARAWVIEHYVESHVMRLTTEYYESLLYPADAARLHQPLNEVKDGPATA